MDWSETEVDLIIADYFSMLTDELNGIPVNKAEHRRGIQKLLNNRSEGSIEFKHQNISAVLMAIGRPYIIGYKARSNYQKILEDKVIEYLIDFHENLESNFRLFSEKHVKQTAKKGDYSKILVAPPKATIVQEPRAIYNTKLVKINYLEREQRNMSLGKAGEELVLEYERWSLRSIGKDKLADQVEWISHDQGDSAGFDILSKDVNGKDKYIEVKTTKLAKETPFYFTKNELDFSIHQAAKYNLYRVFNFEQDARLFTKQGDLNSICHSHPVSFKGYF